MRYFIDSKTQQMINKMLNEGDVPINLLSAVPELAQEERMTNALTKGLSALYLWDREGCAKILDYIGDSHGVDHLVYNSLLYHPLLKWNQEKAKGWGHNAVRVADKLNDKQVQLLIDDMIEHQICHAPTLAYAKTDNIVPAMLELLDKELKLQRFAAYVLAYHGNNQGALILKGWAESSSYPHMPLEALSQLPGDQWMEFLQPFSNPNHPIYTKANERYRYAVLANVLPSIRLRLALKKVTGLHDKADLLTAEYGRLLQTIEIYAGNKQGNKITREVIPPVNVLNVFNKNTMPVSRLLLHDILIDLADQSLQIHLAKKQRKAVLNLIERADLHFENLLDASLRELSGVMRRGAVGGLRSTGFLNKDKHWQNLFKIHYDTEDYLNVSTDWILNPLRYRTIAFGYDM